MTGSLAPPPPYGSEQGSILLEAGRDGGQLQQPERGGGGGGGYNITSASHGRSRSGGNFRVAPPQSPGPVRSPTEISLAQLVHVPSREDDDVGEGTSRRSVGGGESPVHPDELGQPAHSQDYWSAPPPDYSSPEGSLNRRDSDESGGGGSGGGGRAGGGSGRGDGEERPLLRREDSGPQVPSYDDAVGNHPEPRRERGGSR